MLYICCLFCSCGCSLGAEDRYKIDKTAMGEVMSRKREGGGGTGGVADPGTSSGTEVGVSKMEAKSGEQQEEAGGDEDELELEEILHSCTDADQGRADQDMLCSNLGGCGLLRDPPPPPPPLSGVHPHSS